MAVTIDDILLRITDLEDQNVRMKALIDKLLEPEVNFPSVFFVARASDIDSKSYRYHRGSWTSVAISVSLDDARRIAKTYMEKYGYDSCAIIRADVVKVIGKGD